MYYINSIKSATSNYGNPQSNNFPNSLVLPDELLDDYVNSMGFVILTVEDGIVTSVKRNEEAYNAYQESLPTPTPPEPSEEEDVDSMLIDHELRISMLELGGDV